MREVMIFATANEYKVPWSKKKVPNPRDSARVSCATRLVAKVVSIRVDAGRLKRCKETARHQKPISTE